MADNERTGMTSEEIAKLNAAAIKEKLENIRAIEGTNVREEAPIRRAEWDIAISTFYAELNEAMKDSDKYERQTVSPEGRIVINRETNEKVLDKEKINTISFAKYWKEAVRDSKLDTVRLSNPPLFDAKCENIFNVMLSHAKEQLQQTGGIHLDLISKDFIDYSQRTIEQYNEYMRSEKKEEPESVPVPDLLPQIIAMNFLKNDYERNDVIATFIRRAIKYENKLVEQNKKSEEERMKRQNQPQPPVKNETPPEEKNSEQKKGFKFIKTKKTSKKLKTEYNRLNEMSKQIAKAIRKGVSPEMIERLQEQLKFAQTEFDTLGKEVQYRTSQQPYYKKINQSTKPINEQSKPVPQSLGSETPPIIPRDTITDQQKKNQPRDLATASKEELTALLTREDASLYIFPTGENKEHRLVQIMIPSKENGEAPTKINYLCSTDIEEFDKKTVLELVSIYTDSHTLKSTGGVDQLIDRNTKIEYFTNKTITDSDSTMKVVSENKELIEAVNQIVSDKLIKQNQKGEDLTLASGLGDQPAKKLVLTSDQFSAISKRSQGESIKLNPFDSNNIQSIKKEDTKQRMAEYASTLENERLAALQGKVDEAESKFYDSDFNVQRDFTQSQKDLEAAENALFEAQNTLRTQEYYDNMFSGIPQTDEYVKDNEFGSDKKIEDKIEEENRKGQYTHTDYNSIGEVDRTKVAFENAKREAQEKFLQEEANYNDTVSQLQEISRRELTLKTQLNQTNNRQMAEKLQLELAEVGNKKLFIEQQIEENKVYRDIAQQQSDIVTAQMYGEPYQDKSQETSIRNMDEKEYLKRAAEQQKVTSEELKQEIDEIKQVAAVRLDAIKNQQPQPPVMIARALQDKSTPMTITEAAKNAVEEASQDPAIQEVIQIAAQKAQQMQSIGSILTQMANPSIETIREYYELGLQAKRADETSYLYMGPSEELEGAMQIKMGYKSNNPEQQTKPIVFNFKDKIAFENVMTEMTNIYSKNSSRNFLEINPINAQFAAKSADGNEIILNGVTPEKIVEIHNVLAEAQQTKETSTEQVK